MLLVPLVSAQTITGEVTAVFDGDDIEVQNNGKNLRIRLAEIDCPERGQPFSENALRFTIRLAMDRQVEVDVVEKDRYGRTVGRVTLPNGKSLNRELVRAGYAWWYKQYSSDISLGLLEMQARLAKRGLWAVPGATPPWEYRKENRQ